MSKKRILEILFGTEHVLEIIPGLAFSVLVTIVGIQLTIWMASLLALTESPVSAIMMAIVLGIIVKNRSMFPRDANPGSVSV